MRSSLPAALGVSAQQVQGVLASAYGGALLSLRVFHQELNIFSFVGLIMLIGLVKKNGIIMVDFALQLQREGALGPREAIQACRVRFRPIMMTTLAAILGTLPIALGLGNGAEARRALCSRIGIAAVGGLVVSQLLTLRDARFLYRHGAHQQQSQGFTHIRVKLLIDVIPRAQ
jgi:hydrophobic/amphiphilic exporter-1 (mainly G- bacteria), HAE1 family